MSNVQTKLCDIFIVFINNIKLWLFADVILDASVAWQIGFQNPATPVMEGIIWLHNYIFFFLIIVIIVVFWFLARSLYLFDKSVNFSALEFNHDPVIEAIWTIAPAVVLVAIAIPSFSLLYSMEEIVKPVLTLKVIGHQWYWSYELDNVVRTDVLYEYVKRDNMPSIDLYDLQRWEGKKVTEYFFGRVNKWKKAINKLYMHKVIMKTVRANDGMSVGYISYLTRAAKLFWPNATYRSLTAVSRRELFDISHHRVKSTFYALLMPISHTFSTISLVKWVSPSLRFDSYMLNDNDLPIGGFRLLEVDNRLILPVKVHIRVLVTSTDVIHSWAVPSFGIKVDAIPGRLNQVALYIKRDGFFYGQCSELCGVNHGFMPINVQSVDYNLFVNWIRLNSNPIKLSDLVNSNWYIHIDDVIAGTRGSNAAFTNTKHELITTTTNNEKHN